MICSVQNYEIAGDKVKFATKIHIIGPGRKALVLTYISVGCMICDAQNHENTSNKTKFSTKFTKSFRMKKF
jgi:hypothetical protein